ncbi:MAG TPA: hypothetical protein VHX42_00710 [Candidatus Babeliales bacterium]|jgi:hypothetical protein|nr:hypothetical protein [Candidatus Babeliales bacterium]
MKFSNISLTFLIFVSSTLCTHELMFTHKEINEQALIIEKKMTRDRYIVYGLTALSLAQQMYPWIAMYQKGKAVSETNAAEQLSMLQSIKAAFNHLLYTKEGWISLVQAGVSLGGGIVISNICNTFIHPDTLRWYVHSHAPYVLTLTMMKQQIVVLQDDTCEADQKLEAQKLLHLLYDRLVQQSRLMCAYMTYKTKQLDDEEKEVAQRTLHILIDVQNNYLFGIAQQLKATVVDYQELEKMLCKYQKDSNSHVNHFAVIEGETIEERYVVKQRVKRSL